MVPLLHNRQILLWFEKQAESKLKKIKNQTVGVGVVKAKKKKKTASERIERKDDPYFHSITNKIIPEN